jgi:hypothetical protein
MVRTSLLMEGHPEKQQCDKHLCGDCLGPLVHRFWVGDGGGQLVGGGARSAAPAGGGACQPQPLDGVTSCPIAADFQPRRMAIVVAPTPIGSAACERMLDCIALNPSTWPLAVAMDGACNLWFQVGEIEFPLLVSACRNFGFVVPSPSSAVGGEHRLFGPFPSREGYSNHLYIWCSEEDVNWIERWELDFGRRFSIVGSRLQCRQGGWWP